MKKFAMFDLDGTLIDSAPGILGGFAYAAEFFGLKDYDKRDFMKYIGPPLLGSFVELLGEEKAAAAVEKYREYYYSKGQFECALYEGVKEALCRLKKAGMTLILATSKKEDLAAGMLEHLGLGELFAVAAGSDDEKGRGDKTAVMCYAMEKAGITDPGEAIMVGDRKFDVESARELGVECIGVLYGFGSREELMSYGADFIAETAMEAADIILGKKA